MVECNQWLSIFNGCMPVVEVFKGCMSMVVCFQWLHVNGCGFSMVGCKQTLRVTGG